MTMALLSIGGEHVPLITLFLFKAHHEQMKTPLRAAASPAQAVPQSHKGLLGGKAGQDRQGTGTPGSETAGHPFVLPSCSIPMLSPGQHRKITAFEGDLPRDRCDIHRPSFCLSTVAAVQGEPYKLFLCSVLRAAAPDGIWKCQQQSQG